MTMIDRLCILLEFAALKNSSVLSIYEPILSWYLRIILCFVTLKHAGTDRRDQTEIGHDSFFIYVYTNDVYIINM